MGNKKIIKRVYFAVDFTLRSPLNISNGQDVYTDKDVLRRKDGKVFIPGTSVAGALRNAMDKKIRNQFAGYSDDLDGKMSSIFFSDIVLENANVVVRDGVKLNADKTVDNKYDMQAVETGANGKLFMEYTVREQDDEDKFHHIVEQLIMGIQANEIRFGANKNRGFGSMKVDQVRETVFTRENVDSYISFDKEDIDSYNSSQTFEEWEKTKRLDESRYVTIEVPLRLTGGISIRKYSTKPKEADYEQLTIALKDENGNPIPVIPGSSWNGAIRADVRKTLQQLGDKNADQDVMHWFGHIGETSCQSTVVIGESKLEGSKPLTISRNKINRFDASTMNGALYTEKSYFGGSTNLKLMVRKDSEATYEALIGALLLVIQDIQSGYQSIGGLSSIGRGMFEANGDIVLSEGTEESYRKALYTYLFEGAM